MKDKIITAAENIEREALYAGQADAISAIREINGGEPKYALVETYGCQQNEADSDRLRGMLCSCGYYPTEDRQKADLILFNTCAVREHAELRVFGNIGALTHLKKKKPGLILGLCGCMMQQQHRIDEIMQKHGHISFIMGTHNIYKLPEILHRVLLGERVCSNEEAGSDICEDMPVDRKDKVRANVTIMYGCDNFCTYCVVPYVRGRERSRPKEHIVSEVRGLIEEGYKEIMLLGQNVNSYGKGLYDDYAFPALLKDLDALAGDHIISFMTSHPKDATRELIDVVAAGQHISKQLHLPVQSGSARILSEMNRGYTPKQYMELADYAKGKIADLSLTSDIIVGFPGESDGEFEETLEFIKEIEFDALFTFIYSKRRGTPAADMDGQIPKELKSSRIARLIETQAEVSINKNSRFIGKTLDVVVTGVSASDRDVLAARTKSGKLTHFKGTAAPGSGARVKITRISPYALYGEAEQEKK